MRNIRTNNDAIHPLYVALVRSFDDKILIAGYCPLFRGCLAANMAQLYRKIKKPRISR